MAEASDFEKMVFRLTPDDWHGLKIETMFVKPIASTQAVSTFLLSSSPFYFTNASLFDVVTGVPGLGGQLEFARVVERSGHSTYMILVEPDSEDFNQYWEEILALGCDAEAAKHEISLGKKILFSIDVPPQSDIHKLYEILEAGERLGIWFFQEGHVSHKLD